MKDLSLKFIEAIHPAQAAAHTKSQIQTDIYVAIVHAFRT